MINLKNNSCSYISKGYNFLINFKSLRSYQRNRKHTAIHIKNI